MNLPAESLITRTVELMNAQLAQRIPGEDVAQLRSGLLYMGNVQDAFPRRLLLDARLSPLDKMAWMMIRLYAQQNQGAVFPSYDDLQLQLASPGKGRASRETVSRVLLMLRITGWLSLCKRVRDERGRVRGNVYAQHDEPVTCRDAEVLDPRWLDTVAEACRHRNRTISQTAWEVLQDIKDDPQMRHRHSHITLVESRLRAAQTPGQLAVRQRENIASQPPGSVSELSQKIPGSDAELSSLPEKTAQSSDTELSLQSGTYKKSPGVRKPNGYVRSFTQSDNKNTYVNPRAMLPDNIVSQIKDEDADMLTCQLQALPGDLREQVLQRFGIAQAAGKLSNPVGWLLAVMKRAREGALFSHVSGREDAVSPPTADTSPSCRLLQLQSPRRASSPEHVSSVVAEIRRRMAVEKGLK
ncbi:STY4528 family pathogenicity island replication protein [Cedecea sp. NFIX57]|uniref:STY4528 family pathogenicity island replication protein n=1 Tax=Cedecea sp. NFIX57 TaxID=1566286 RepID=UPI000A0966E1|nr:STY4528 family pathogenicity island replication protein [Cedecea sp. NFIX57]SMG55512.1 Helix-turn-helix domain-containing protein [Cedecea sp. NFIX57]